MADTGEYKLRLVVESMVGNAVKDFVKARLGANALGVASGSLMKTLGKTALKFGVLATAVTVTAKVIKAGTEASIQFNTALANVATLIPQEEARLLSLKGTIKELSIESGKSFGDLTDGVYQVISAFGDAVDTEKKLNIVTKSAIAGQASTTESLNLLSAVTKAYGDTSATALGQVSDLAFLTVKLGQTTYPELARSIQQVTSLSEMLNVGQEELFATFATLTGVTGDASIVATQFKAILNALLSPTDSLTNLMGELGVSSGKAMTEEYGFQGSLQEIIKYSNKLHIPLRDLVSSQEAIIGVQALGSAQADVFNEKLKAMQTASGTTNIAFNEVANGINEAGFSLGQLNSMVKVVMTQIGDYFTPSVALLASGLTSLIGKISGNVTAQTQMKGSIEDLITLSSDYVKINDDISKSVDGQTTAYLNLQKAMLEQKIQDTLEDLSKDYQGTKDDIEDMGTSLKKSNSVIKTHGEFFEELGDKLGITIDSSMDWVKAMEDMDSQTKGNEKNNMKFNQSLESMGYNWSYFTIMLVEYKAALGNVNGTTSDLNLATAEQEYQMQLVAQAVADGTTNIDSMASKNKDLYDSIMLIVKGIKESDLAKASADSTQTITEQMEAFKKFSVEQLNAEITSLQYAKGHEASAEGRKTLTELINALLEKRNGLQKTETQLAEAYKKTMLEQYQTQLAELTAGEGLVKIEEDRAKALLDAKINHADDAELVKSINALYDEQTSTFDDTLRSQLDYNLAVQEAKTEIEGIEVAREKALALLEKQGITTDLNVGKLKEEGKTDSEIEALLLKNKGVIDDTNKLYDEQVDTLVQGSKEEWQAKLDVLNTTTEMGSLEVERALAIATATENYKGQKDELQDILDLINEVYDKKEEDVGKDKKPSYLKEFEDWGKNLIGDDAYTSLTKFQEEVGRVQEAWGQMSGVYDAVSDAFSSYNDNVMNGLESELSIAETDAEVKRTTADDALKILEGENTDKLDSLKGLYDDDAISYEEYLAKKAEIEAGYQASQNVAEASAIEAENAVLKAQYEIDKEAFKEKKRSSIANAVIAGAEGIMQAWALGPIAGIAGSIAIGGATAYNISQIAGQTGPSEPTYAAIPAFAEGGIVSSATNAIVGEAGPEAIIPLNKFEETVFGGKSGSRGEQHIYNFKDVTFFGVNGIDEVITTIEKRKKVLTKRGRI